LPGFFAALTLMFKQVMLFVSYVKNNAFPQPLSEQEEEKHLQRMAEGDSYSRNMLIEHNLRLVAHIVKMICTKSRVRCLCIRVRSGWREWAGIRRSGLLN
jgi:hypothetical protein